MRVSRWAAMRWFLVSAILVVIVAFALLKRGRNNVCKTFEDYYSNRDKNKNCYYNPDHELTTPEIITRHGYPAEEHKVTTEDGYILKLFRIPHGKNSTKIGRPILVQHGVAINSGAFVNIGTKSLGFVLADAGFDVWLGNFRGTVYSRNHSSFSPTSPEFWNFSIHELGFYDIPAKINYITKLTNQKIGYLGFSMGTSAEYIYSTTFPEEAEKNIDVTVSLAPIVFMGNIRYFSVFSRLWFIARDTLQYLTNGQLTPRPIFPPLLFKIICLPFPIQLEICQIPDMVILSLSFNYAQNDPETLPVTLQHNRDSTSIKIISHFSQLMTTGSFRQFDYGPEENTKRYGSEKPPPYNLSKLRVRHHLVRAPNDLLSTEKNVDKLHASLPERIKFKNVYVVNDEKFNHVDIFTGKDAAELVYKPIARFFSENLNKTETLPLRRS